MGKRLSQAQIRYRRYLESPGWRKRRDLALARADHRCEREGCDRTRPLHVHHLTYARVGSELPADLMVLCRDHHREEHKLRRRKRRKAKAAPTAKKKPRAVTADRFSAAREHRDGPAKAAAIPPRAEREERKRRGLERVRGLVR